MPELNHSEQINFLRNVPLFKELSERDLHIVADLTEQLEVEMDHMLIKEGRTGHKLFIVVKGTAQVTRRDAPMRTLMKGDAFGEISLIDQSPRTATVVAETNMELLTIDKERFDFVLDNYPEIVKKLLVGMCAYLQ